MQKPEVPIKRDPVKSYSAKDPLLFSIPNPFDDYMRKKENWYIEIKKIEEVIKSLRERMNELVALQVQHRDAIKTMRDYCMTTPRKKVRR
jgi:broad specificity phosphatase PhoE